MRYLIIGLGIYGSNLAIDLTRMGHEVIGADTNASIVESIKDNISTAYIIDSTDEPSLAALPLKNVDIVIVAIGENFGASIRTVALLKKLGVKHIFARAIDRLHESILESFDIERIITPEQRAARDLVNEMGVNGHIESMAIDPDHYVLKFPVPEFMTGMSYADLDMEKDYGMKLIAVTRKKPRRNIMGLERGEHIMIADSDLRTAKVESGDHLTCLGSESSFRTLFRNIAQ